MLTRTSGSSSDEMSPGSSPRGQGAKRTADDLGAPGLRKRLDEDDPLGGKALAQRRDDVARELRRELGAGLVRRGRERRSTTATSPLTSCGMPATPASATAGCSTRTDSISAGPIRLPAMLSVSSERPNRNQ